MKVRSENCRKSDLPVQTADAEKIKVLTVPDAPFIFILNAVHICIPLNQKEPAVPQKLEEKSIEELVALQTEIAELIRKKQRRKKAELQKQFKELAEQAGMSVEEVLDIKNSRSSGRAGKKTKTKSPAGNIKIKYIKDGKTWSGRGRKPAWVIELIQQGGDLEKYRAAPEKNTAPK